MSLKGALRAAAAHSMRAYYVPIVAGAALAVSAFLPAVVVGEHGFGGVPGLARLWTLGLGTLAVALASLSIATRKNSRHPLLLVGLVALGLVVLASRLLDRAAAEQAWATAQARAIVEGGAAPKEPVRAFGAGTYLGLAASIVLVGFGLTIIVKRVKTPYAAEDE